MGQSRSQLHDILESITEHVYFQPPTNVKLSYPCIIYQRDYADTKFADDIPYNHTKRYQVTVIDRDPDSDIPDKVALLPMSIFNRFFTADDLNHDVYVVFF
jgi:hypothetical protein